MKKLFKNVLQFFFVSFLCGIAQTAWAQDEISGLTYNTSGEYYEINDAQDLVDLANYVNGGNNASGKTFKQTRDIDMSGISNFIPIGSNGNNYSPTPFNGTYDGQGNAIIGLTVGANSPYGGLFGLLQGGSISNVTMVNPDIKGAGSFDTHVGGVVGMLKPGTISNCNVINPTLSGKNKGAICGCIHLRGSAVSDCYFYTTGSVNAVGFNTFNQSVTGGRTYTMTLGDGVTTSTKPAFSYDGTDYYNGTITLATAPIGWVYPYSVNGSAIDGNSFTISGNTTVSRGDAHISPLLGYDDDPLVDGSADHPYVISTADGWNLFCDMLDNYDKGYFTGKTVKLGANITVSRMAGVRYHDFTGTFDGNKKTLTFNYGSEGSPATEEYTAPFRYVEDGCTIKNLHVDGEIFTKAKYATGLIGSQYGAVSIENCRSSIVIHSTVINNDQNDGTHAGFVATNASSNGSKLTIEGCLFDGKILTTSTNTTSRCAGFVGWKNTGVTIKNSIYAPAAIADGETEVVTGTGSNLSATFSRNGGTFTNCFYTRTLGTVQGEASLSVSAGKDVTVSNVAPVGEAKNTYDVSGITAYNKGLSYGNKFYYGNGDDVNLTLSHSTTPEGYSFDGYTASSGTLVGTQNPYTLTMSDGNVTINASFSENVLTLDDASDNSKDIYYAANGGLVYKTVTLSGRTLYKDGAWNTLCLPFDVKLSESVLAGAKARKLTAASVKGSTFNLTFSDEVTELEAGVPYIIKWESGENITNPVFNNVTVDATDRSFNNGVSGDGRVRFIGTNNTVSFTDDDNALLMGAENTLYYVNAGACIRANRAYFRIGDDDVYCARRITSFNIDFSDETTGISGNCRVDDVDSSWFTLQGVKLADKPTQNGVYIHNGKKVVIK